jgi:hypothetical protein
VDKRHWDRARLLVAGVIVALALAEGLCQVGFIWLRRRWDAIRRDPGHFYQASQVPELAYELQPDVTYVSEGRVLRTNDLGFRGDTWIAERAVRAVGLLGDSVVFGTHQDQSVTLSVLLEKELTACRAPDGSRVRVANLGVPGYATAELNMYLQRVFARVHLEHVTYLLNLNDFCARDTVYEGADNGLYRMYRPPSLMLPWVFRKAVYRYQKGDAPTSVRWYRWLYRGNRERVVALIREMATTAHGHGSSFTVVLLPAGVAFVGARYLLEDIEEDLTSTLRQAGISCDSAVAVMRDGRARLYDRTDHLTANGNRQLVPILARSVPRAWSGC